MENTNRLRRIKLNNVYSLIGTTALYFKQGDEEKSYALQRVTPDELVELRKSNIPGFVLKVGNKLFYTEIPKETYLHTSARTVSKHKCGNCSRCRTIKDNNKGCPKIRDCSARVYIEEGAELHDAVVFSKRIEKYGFINLGFETFNVDMEDFTVARCGRFQESSNIPKKTLGELNGIDKLLK